MINAQEARNNVAKKLLEGMTDIYEKISKASKAGDSFVNVYNPIITEPMKADLYIRGFEVEYHAGYDQRDSEYWTISW